MLDGINKISPRCNIDKNYVLREQCVADAYMYNESGLQSRINSKRFEKDCDNHDASTHFQTMTKGHAGKRTKPVLKKQISLKEKSQSLKQVHHIQHILVVKV